MNALSRRRLLAGGAASLALLAGCANLTSDQAASDVKLIANGLSGIVSALGNLPAKLKPEQATLDKIQTEIEVIKANAAKIGTAITPTPAVAQDIAMAVDAIVPLVTPFFPAAPAVAAVIQAALALVPVILAAAGVSQAPRAMRLAPGMSPEQARLILAAGVE